MFSFVSTLHWPKNKCRIISVKVKDRNPQSLFVEILQELVTLDGPRAMNVLMFGMAVGGLVMASQTVDSVRAQGMSLED